MIYIDGDTEQCLEELVIAQLLIDEVLFANTRITREGDETIVLFVAVNDVFNWGQADVENITTDKVAGLYKLHIENKKWGAIKWVCLQRNKRPQLPIIIDMQSDGYWDDDLERLP